MLQLNFIGRNKIAEEKIFIELCLIAKNMRKNSDRKKAEETLVIMAVTLMKNLHDLEVFTRTAALHSTKHLAVKMYIEMKWIKKLKEFPSIAKLVDVKKCGGKKVMDALVKIIMPSFKNIKHATPFDLSRMANIIFALPEKERNIVLELISTALIKLSKNEREFFSYLETIKEPLAHNCIIAHFAASGKMKTLIIAEKVLEKVKPGHPSADAAMEAVIMESIQLFKKAKLPEIGHFLNTIKKQKVTKKLQTALTKTMMEK